MDTLNLKGSVGFLRKYKKHLGLTFVISGVVAAGLSLLLPNYYKSEVLLLPSDTNSISKSIVSEGDRFDPYVFGTEQESEYIAELLSSWQIVEKTAIKFNLKQHYGLKKYTPLANERMLLKLKKNIKVKRSDYLGIRLQVWDKDPKYACNMANYMVEQLETLRQNMKQVKADSIKAEIEISRQRVQRDVLKLNDSLSSLQQKAHIVYPANYTDRLAQEYGKQVAAGNHAAMQRLEAKMDTAAKYSARIQQLLNDMENKSKTIKSWDEYYEQALINLESQIPVDFIAQKAVISYDKDKPKRSIIVILAAIACTLIAAGYFVIKEKYIAKDVEENKGNN